MPCQGLYVLLWICQAGFLRTPNPFASAALPEGWYFVFKAMAVHLTRPMLPSTCLPRSSVINSAKSTLPPVNSSAAVYSPVLSSQTEYASRLSLCYMSISNSKGSLRRQITKVLWNTLWWFLHTSPSSLIHASCLSSLKAACIVESPLWILPVF